MCLWLYASIAYCRREEFEVVGRWEVSALGTPSMVSGGRLETMVLVIASFCTQFKGGLVRVAMAGEGGNVATN